AAATARSNIRRGITGPRPVPLPSLYTASRARRSKSPVSSRLTTAMGRCRFFFIEGLKRDRIRQRPLLRRGPLHSGSRNGAVSLTVWDPSARVTGRRGFQTEAALYEDSGEILLM